METVKSNLRLTFGTAIVTMSLLLVLVVGYAQALKSYRQLSSDAVFAQTQATRLGIEQVLKSGVPLSEIAGLNLVLQPIVKSDPSVTGLTLFAGSKELYRTGTQSDEESSITIALNNKFSQIGTLKVYLSQQKVEEKVTSTFQPMMWLILILLLVFIGSVLRSRKRAVYLTSFTVVFFAMTVCVMMLVGSLYRDGLHSKAISLADIVSYRLSPVLEYDIDRDMITGVDSMLDHFRRANPELASISVYKSAQLVATSVDDNAMGQMMVSNGGLEYALSTSGEGEVRLSYQAEMVIGQLAQVLKNFAILFFACGLVCFAFIRLLSGELNQSPKDQVLERLKPLFLGAVLMEALMAPILPQFLTSVAEANGLGASASSLFFALYFLGFALTLLPAARLIETFDIRQVLFFGILLSTLGCALLGFSESGEMSKIIAARFISGVGQSLIFISVQGYILRFSDKSNKTQAAGIIVFCFNAGFISGAAIGALLVSYFGDIGIFTISAAIGTVMCVFSLILPSMPGSIYRAAHGQAVESGTLLSNIKAMAADSWRLIKVPAFIRTMVLVGIPTKAALTGIVSFAVPLMLAEKGVSKESIGQVLMTYAAIVLLVSYKVGPWVDKHGCSKLALSLGNLLAGASLVVLAVAFSQDQDWLIVLLTTLAMLFMGGSHGLINAPVVTHVVNSTAKQESDSSVAVTYRFLERLGHVSGAIIVGQLLFWLDVKEALLTIAAFFVIASVIFMLFDRQQRQGAHE
ncbi:MFS transporter [Photobacterium sanguinicancri]|uniref:MFS transporter n=1 Tax=Photobacterium sanguinicancri TaxID=875932 RepID=UPI0026E1EC64|nr:MFS transporter [Photobacterium sanguinicancri]MDO6496743.1 MFS transporter [Photobacterium sanguinicancri]